MDALLKQESGGIFFFGNLAQLGEHMFCTHRVLGSNPKVSISFGLEKKEEKKKNRNSLQKKVFFFVRKKEAVYSPPQVA